MAQILIVLILLGLLLYVIGLLPIDATIKQIIKAVAIVLVVIWLLGMFFPAIDTWSPLFRRGN
jgi:hypothetical protein